jgi:ribonucleoside-diphosphate reductase alpha chain
MADPTTPEPASTPATTDASPDPVVVSGDAPAADVPVAGAPHRGGDPLRVVEAGGRKGLALDRYFTTEGTHPYDELEWELRDAVLTNWRDGSVSFEQRGVEFPASPGR